jgi:hypothetical protein
MARVPIPRVAPLWPLALALAVAVASCADDPAKFDVRAASDFAKTGVTVSVLGVFKDGRMSAESWPTLGARLSAPFSRTGACEIAYADALFATAPALAASIDEYATANGITDELLDELAPMATADTILVFTIAGHPPQTMTYSGPSAEAALKSFTDKLAAELPAASCRGWKRDAQIDAERIHRMSLEEP